MLYNVVTMLMHDELQEATVYAGITRNEEIMAEASIPISTNALSTLPIKVRVYLQYLQLLLTAKLFLLSAISDMSDKFVVCFYVVWSLS